MKVQQSNIDICVRNKFLLTLSLEEIVFQSSMNKQMLGKGVLQITIAIASKKVLPTQQCWPFGR